MSTYKSILFLTLLFIMGTSNAQDWANLEEFKADNAKIGIPSEGENRVVFMGNSITIGWLYTVPEFFEGNLI